MEETSVQRIISSYFIEVPKHALHLMKGGGGKIFHAEMNHFVAELCLSHPDGQSGMPGGQTVASPGPAETSLNPTWLCGFRQANLIFLNTGLCFSFITAEAGEELQGKAELIGLPEKPVDLKYEGRVIIIIIIKMMRVFIKVMAG